MRSLPATMGLKEMARLAGMPRRTLQRRLQQKAIACEGRRIMMADLFANDPKMFNSLTIAFDKPAPRCTDPECGEMTERRCVMCSRLVA